MPKRSLSAVRREVLRKMESPPTKGKIASMSSVRLVEFQRDIVSRKLSIAAIAEKYELSKGTVINYRNKYLRPALVAAQQNENLDLQRNAQNALWWLFDTSKSGIERLQADPDADPKKLGTLPQLMGEAHSALRTIMEATGELKTAKEPNVDNSVRVRAIIFPKIEGTPARAPSAEIGGPDYAHMKLIDVDSEEFNSVAQQS